MTRLIPILIFVHFFTIAEAQKALCLSKDPVSGRIDFRPEQLNSLLQLDQYRVVFFGEHHNDRFDPEIKYHLITDLNRRSGTRHVFLEIGFSSAWNLNQYLQSGDSTYLYNPAWPLANRPNARLWQRMFQYNRGLPDGQKIVVHGVDFETTGVFRTFKRLTPGGRSVPAILKPVMDTIDAHVSDPPLAMWNVIDGKFIEYDNTPFIKTLRYVQHQFLAHTEVTKAYFGGNYPVVSDIITNEGRVEVSAKRRNRTMFAAMKRIIHEQKIERFIGFFGAQHTTYAVGNSLANAAAGLSGFRQDEILNIAEFAYDTASKDTAFRRKHFHELAALKGSCNATVVPAGTAPGFKKVADFVMITNIGE